MTIVAFKSSGIVDDDEDLQILQVVMLFLASLAGKCTYESLAFYCLMDVPYSGQEMLSFRCSALA